MRLSMTKRLSGLPLARALTIALCFASLLACDNTDKLQDQRIEKLTQAIEATHKTQRTQIRNLDRIHRQLESVRADLANQNSVNLARQPEDKRLPKLTKADAQKRYDATRRKAALSAVREFTATQALTAQQEEHIVTEFVEQGVRLTAFMDSRSPPKARTPQALNTYRTYLKAEVARIRAETNKRIAEKLGPKLGASWLAFREQRAKERSEQRARSR